MSGCGAPYESSALPGTADVASRTATVPPVRHNDPNRIPQGMPSRRRMRPQNRHEQYQVHRRITTCICYSDYLYQNYILLMPAAKPLKGGPRRSAGWGLKYVVC